MKAEDEQSGVEKPRMKVASKHRKEDASKRFPVLAEAKISTRK